MDLGSFLTDDTIGGSWADEEVDMSSIGVPINTGGPSRPRRDFGDESFGDEGRPERKEFPIPDKPPFRARIGNLPWETSEGILRQFFQEKLNRGDVIENMSLPTDNMTGKLKGFAFVSFTERSLLEEALKLNLTELNGRRIFVNVAAPSRHDAFDMDWRAARTAPVNGDRKPRREDPDLDWSSVRSFHGPRERGGPRGEGRGEGRPRREEPDLDWTSVRTSGGVVSGDRGDRGDRGERRPKRQEADLDWGSVRSSPGAMSKNKPRKGDRKPKKDEPELDWSAVRHSPPAIPQKDKPRRFQRKGAKDSDIDWSAARSGSNEQNSEESDWKRGQVPQSQTALLRNTQKPEEEKKDSSATQTSRYHILGVEGEGENEPENNAEGSEQN